MKFVIKELYADLVEQYIWFFDNRAFCDNPEWAGCYCLFYQCKENLDTWMKRTVSENRAEALQSVKNGSLKGYLAFVSDKPVAFCNVNLKANLTFDKYRTEVNNTGVTNIVSLVCFVVDPNYRRKGLSKLFLERAIKDYSQKYIIEAYPSKEGQENKDNYHGYAQMYIDNDFVVKSEHEKYYVMQRIN